MADKRVLETRVLSGVGVQVPLPGPNYVSAYASGKQTGFQPVERSSTLRADAKKPGGC